MSDYGSEVAFHAPDYVKDPNSVEDYAFNWVLTLDGDTISTSTFSLPDGLTEVSYSNDDTSATIFVSGGSEGSTYRIRNRITTAEGRTYDKTVYVFVAEQ